jgi:hypothetical protein
MDLLVSFIQDFPFSSVCISHGSLRRIALYLSLKISQYLFWISLFLLSRIFLSRCVSHRDLAVSPVQDFFVFLIQDFPLSHCISNRFLIPNLAVSSLDFSVSLTQDFLVFLMYLIVSLIQDFPVSLRYLFRITVYLP